MSVHRAGGAATAAGMDFQNRVAAWIAAGILAEQDFAPPWGLASQVTLEFLRCETEQPVDDILVGTSERGVIFLQVKRSLDLSDQAGAPFAEAITQCVRQVHSRQGKPVGTRPWERPLEPTGDRLIIAVGPTASAPVREHLPNVLRRFRQMGEQADLAAVPQNQDEGRAWQKLLGVIGTGWAGLQNAPPTEAEVRQVLALLWVETFDLEPDGQGEGFAKSLLRQAVLQDPAFGDQIWSALITECARLASERSGSGRPELQAVLLKQGFPLQVPRSYRSDIEKLQGYSIRSLQALKHLATIPTGSQPPAHIQRECTRELMSAAAIRSVIVIGQPGAGKSGALHDLVTTARDSCDVLFLAVDRLEATTDAALRADLGLEHDLFEVLVNWASTRTGLLVIDALDAARAERTARVLRDLIRRVVGQQCRWRVVAAIRKFDLQYSPELQALFPGEPVSDEFRDPDFPRVAHLNIPRLSNDELTSLLDQAPALRSFVEHAGTELRDLLFVPFNLRILGELVAAGVLTRDSPPIRTQVELLDQFWIRRVIREDTHGDAREGVLARACDAMVTGRTLRVDRSIVAAEVSSSSALNDVLSSHVLSEWRPSPGARPERRVLTFSHHVLFDYAVSRLVFSPDPARLIDQLANDPELAVAFRQSIILYLRARWALDHTRRYFWDVAIQIAQDNRVHPIAKLIAPTVAADAAQAIGDLQPLLDLLHKDDEAMRIGREHVLQHLVGAVLALQSAGKSLVGPHGGPWAEFIDGASQC